MSVYSVDKNTGDISIIAGGTNFSDTPIGTILPFGSNNIPSSFLLCDGTELNRADYPELFAVIGTSFGTPSANTKFKLPDLRGEFLRGAGTNSHSGQGHGGTVGQHQDATEHFRESLSGSNLEYINLYSPKNNEWVMAQKADAGVTSLTGRAAYVQGSGSATASTDLVGYTSRPTNTSVNYIIKAVQAPVPADFMSKVDEVVEEALDGIGTITKATTNIGTAVSCASQSTTILTSVSLNAGTYVLSASADHTTANAEAVISITEGSAVNDEFKQYIPSVTAYSANTGNVTAILKLTATTTVRLVCWSAGNLNVTPRSLVATKVA